MTMKKYLIALVLGLVLLLALATTIALADNGPHGGFSANTDACAGCHRIHSAKSADGMLLVQGDIYLLCTSCHDGSGAYTNVVDGTYASGSYAVGSANQGESGYPLFAGGFENVTMAHTGTQHNYYDPALASTTEPVTSSHKVDGVTAGTVYGAGNYNATASIDNGKDNLTLECTSCHNPHGKAGKTGNSPSGSPLETYRLLDFTPVGSGGYEVTGSPAWWTNTVTTAGINVPDVLTKWYTPNDDIALDPSVAFWSSRWDGLVQTPYTAYIQGPADMAGRTYVYKRPAASASGVYGASMTSCANLATGTPGVYDAGVDMPTTPPTACGGATGTLFDNTGSLAPLSLFCAQCHDRYAASSARTTNSGDAIFMYRHTSASSSVPCVACHNAHGTASVMTTSLAQNATFVTPVGDPTHNSYLLKMDNRALCVDCHGNSVNAYSSVVVPTQIAPTITSINPDNGAAAGGISVAIVGTNFGSSITTVAFGAVSYTTVSTTPVAGQCKVNSSTSITCKTAAAPAGAVTVTITVGTMTVTTTYTFN